MRTRTAHGLQLIGVADPSSRIVQSLFARTVIRWSPKLDEIRWKAPVRPGDTLRVVAEVLEARPSSSKPDRGIVKTMVEAANSGGATVMRATAINFMLVRPDSGA